MPDELIVQHCSPTLAGIKTGNIFTYRYKSREALNQRIRHLNRMLGVKGLRVVPLRASGTSALIYVYRPSRLEADLSSREAAQILAECGYGCGGSNRCVVELAGRLREKGEFPHEIGLFLGYPPEDVRGFIDNNAQCFKCVGCWKVYGDAQKATELFEKYKKCTACYLKQLMNGNTIEQLTVAV